MRRVRKPWVGLVIGLGVAAAGGVWWTQSSPRTPVAATALAASGAPPAAAPSAPPATTREAPRRAAPLRLIRDEEPLAPTTAPAASASSSGPASSPDHPAAPPATTPAASTPPVATPAAPSATPPAAATVAPREELPAVAPGTAAQADPRIVSARRAYEGGALLEARRQLNALLASAPGPAEAEARTLLTRLADETLFSRQRVPDDPLVEWYTIRDNDRLANISRRYDVPHEVIAVMNGIRNPARDLRVGQAIKAPRGPFHARIYKSALRLDLYLQDQYVRSFRVCIGSPETPTPSGVWRVKDRLPSPTYFPPESAVDKRVLPSGHPENPLGSHWIGLEGIEGPAVGQTSYGIHGTIEPESIGKAVSNGCIRLHNEDAEFIYNTLQPGRSLVTILP